MSAFVLVPTAATAQSDPADAKIDCALFSRKADGTWFATAQTSIELGGSQITIPPGEIGPRMFQFGMADLHSVLETACTEKKAEPSRDAEPMLPGR
ncbi:hypothetical protein [Pseudorhodoplanes sp.]|uniref:hypothetical protein n=1 Tax=Pseudorhodoplanes sp. TaxID=1934341 RepID=UPI002BEEA5C8|nr:hypothetical protein [Pseudorhodoplanes sp.]HWV54091.1 hypothetical protein [Pseudorhodoplanes sp.]